MHDVYCDSLETCQLPATRLPVSSLSATIAKKSTARVDDATLVELEHIKASLSSTDCNDRVRGIRRLQELVVSHPQTLAGQLTKVCLLNCLVPQCVSGKFVSSDSSNSF